MVPWVRSRCDLPWQELPGLRNEVVHCEGEEVSSQSGGDGYGKIRKACQTGGASGWAKHCGNTDDHKKSNRIERKLGKQDLDGEVPAPRMRTTRKRDKVPTRRHLMDRWAHNEKEISERLKEMEAHKKKSPPCRGCMSLCGGGKNWFMKWRLETRAKLLKEFDKYGYEKP